MDALFNRNVTGLAPSASIQFMAKAKQMQEMGLDVISLAGGEPDFATPDPIVEEAYRQLKAGFTHYTVGQGLPELRKRIVQKLLPEACQPAEAVHFSDPVPGACQPAEASSEALLPFLPGASWQVLPLRRH